MRRGLGVAALAVSALVLLTGCIPEARIFATLIDGAPAFLICEPIVVETIDVDEVPKGSEIDDSRPLWSARGDGDWAAEYILIMGETPQGFSSLKDATSHDPEAQLLELVLNSGRHKDLPKELDIRAATFFPAALVEGKWVNQVGDVKTDPCG